MFINYTRRRFGGRHPLCGTGVSSRIAVISKPTACNERIAASRPAPGPLTDTSIVFMLDSNAVFAAASAAICAAYGVDFLDPLNPSAPAEFQAITLPCMSEIVTIVLLNVEWICATPFSTTFLVRRLRGAFDFFAIVRFYLLLINLFYLRLRLLVPYVYESYFSSFVLSLVSHDGVLNHDMNQFPLI